MKGKLYGLDLFSGIGGISEGLRQWITPIAYCDNEPYAQAVLLSRMADGYIPRAPIWDDVSTLQKEMLPDVDIIYGGFPCQDISVAGFGKGLEGERSGLFFEIIRLTREINPAFVFLENVPAIRTRGLLEVLKTFTDIGYDCRWTCVSAQEVGALHVRKRWFLLAHSQCSRDGKKFEAVVCQKEKREPNKTLPFSSSCSDLPRQGYSEYRGGVYSTKWEVEPNVGRVVDGLPFRVDRIKALGNAVVPQQVEEAFKKLVGLV